MLDHPYVVVGVCSRICSSLSENEPGVPSAALLRPAVGEQPDRDLSSCEPTAVAAWLKPLQAQWQCFGV